MAWRRRCRIDAYRHCERSEAIQGLAEQGQLCDAKLLDRRVASLLAMTLLKAAQITAAHGIRGEVKLRSFLENPEAIFTHPQLLSADGNTAYTLTRKGKSGDQLIAAIAGIATRNEAEALKGKTLHLPASALPQLKNEDEFYWSELEGMAVVSPEGAALGTVQGVYNFGAGDILEIAFASGEAEMFPFKDAFFPVVDREKRTITFIPPEIT